MTRISTQVTGSRPRRLLRRAIAHDTQPSRSVQGPAVLAAIAMTLAGVCFGLHWLSCIAVGTTGFFLVRVLSETGERIPADTVLLFFASLQWLFAPVLMYMGFSHHYKLRMYVPEPEYMSLAVPGVLCFAAGVYALRNLGPPVNYGALFARVGVAAKRKPWAFAYVVLAGLVASVLQGYVPGPLRFVFYLLSNLKYIGVTYGMFAFPRKKLLLACAGLAVCFLSSIQRAMFHDLILWTLFMGFYFAVTVKPSFPLKLVVLMAGLFGIFLIQTVKLEYRSRVWDQGYSGNRMALFSSLAEESIGSMDDREFAGSALEQMIIRINQGWIISRVMQQVPEVVAFAGGDTIKEALFATLMPRILAPNKAHAGGHKNYTRFTGYTLTGTAMGISILGEGYANFGVFGACIFMFFVGLFYSGVLWLLLKQTGRHPTVILWVPLIFLHATKAETDLVASLNYIVKAAVLVALFLVGTKAMLGREV